MNRDDIIRMAREAGFREYLIQDSLSAELERFAALVAAHERDECARVCESTITPNIDWWNDACQSCANDIRARSEK